MDWLEKNDSSFSGKKGKHTAWDPDWDLARRWPDTDKEKGLGNAGKRSVSLLRYYQYYQERKINAEEASCQTAS